MAPGMRLSEDLESRNTVNINLETVTNTVDTNFPGHFVGEDHAWDVEKFAEDLQIDFHYNSPFDASFSLIHVSAPIANAFRRILLANLPTVAIERVYVGNNTSVIQDEVLASRLGLLPLIVPEPLLRRMHWPQPRGEDGSDPPILDIDHLIFKLQITCKPNKGAAPDEDDPTKRLYNAHVYAKDLVWQPIGRQAQWLGVEGAELEDIPVHLRPRCANPDILLTKLRAGHEVEIEMHAVKGAGQDHAKFSPVATATYRLLPTIEIMKPILGDEAVKFQKCFPEGVIDLTPVTTSEAARKKSEFENRKGDLKAVVKDAFSDTVSRECLRHDEFHGKVKLGRKKDHFIFSIESTGQYPSHELFSQSIRCLRAKCVELKEAINTITI